ncbi:hypothetical protein KY338_06855 [Candidatus Woesearchaeota archaeon]|nr:hypothetical protein [Candidatus Woesearchaeota archaeon]MBW3006377.1 hypothetical protein [Candidatus Woesearchaeota archaeon]
MQTFSTELAEEVLTRFKERGWVLYAAESFNGRIDPEATVRNGPAEQLEKDRQYVILPEIDDPTDYNKVSSAIAEILDKINSPPSLPHGPNGIVLESIILREEDVAIPDKKGTDQAALIYDQFLNALNKFFDRNAERQINYAKIDAPVRDLIYKLNKVRFVSTIECKSAELWAEEMPSKGGFIKADADCCFVTGAYILLNVEEHAHAKSFITDVEKLLSKYTFAEMFDENGHKKIVLTCDDITQIDKMQEEENPVINALLKEKYSHQTTKEQGRKRMWAFQAIRDGLVEIAEKYINPQPGMTKEYK